MKSLLRADYEFVLVYAYKQELTVTAMAGKIRKSFDATYRMVAALRKENFIKDTNLKNKKDGFIQVSEKGIEYLTKARLIKDES